MEQVKELLEQAGYSCLGYDEAFSFGCVGCGKCCTFREDILLSPLDLFKMANYLNVTIDAFLHTYCDCYIGEETRLPLVRIQPQGSFKTCPLNSGGKCLVHAAKPYVCACYPLGFFTMDGAAAYFLQPDICNKKPQQAQTVRQWLAAHGILDDEDFVKSWHAYTCKISTMLRKLQGGTRKKLVKILHEKLYLAYDLEQDFPLQFSRNCEGVLMLLEQALSISG